VQGLSGRKADVEGAKEHGGAPSRGQGGSEEEIPSLRRWSFLDQGSGKDQRGLGHCGRRAAAPHLLGTAGVAPTRPPYSGRLGSTHWCVPM